MRMTTKLREEMKKGILVRVGVTNPLTARLAESLGFKCLCLAGSQLGWDTCKPEPLTSAEDYVKAARPIIEAVNIPMTSEGCTGFGDAAHTAYSVKQYIKAGIAGMHLEDQVYPKRMGYWGPKAHAYERTKYVISMEEMVTKIKAAIKMRDELDPDFVIDARTDAFGAVGGGMEEAIKRCKAYWEAGADGIMIFPSHEPTLELLTTVRERLPPPIRIHAGVISSKFSVKEYEKMGYDIYDIHNHLTVIAIKAIREFLIEARDTDRLPESYDTYRAETRKIINDLTGMPELWQIEKEQEEAIGLPKTMKKP
jgi:2-methylisocitrate lyase-like PEP mutase family enzyme